MRIALGQINPTVGDISGNARLIVGAIDRARRAGADLLVVPELAVTGYPPKDLLLRPAFIRANVEAVSCVAASTAGIAVVLGYVGRQDGSVGRGIVNAAALLCDGRIVAEYAKRLLPTYDVFDESRYFDRGEAVCVADVPAGGRHVRVGLTICEDLWNDRQFVGRRLYGVDPIAETVAAGAELIVNISASPFTDGKQAVRESLFAPQVRQHDVPLAYCAQVGGNDDLVFDGASAVFDADGNVIARAKSFAEDLLVVDLGGSDEATQRRSDGGKGEAGTQHSALSTQHSQGARRHEGAKAAKDGPCRLEPHPDRLDALWSALVLGTRDYVRKCGFENVVLGLSGGIDSALTAAIAADALGPARVLGVAMPSRFTSAVSLEDAQALAERLGIEYRVISIEGVHTAAEEALGEVFAGLPRDVTEENIQARSRGSILMALSNKFGRLLLTTGNKSELAVGYCTLYGDMCGGLAVISDVPKTTVYDLARRFNARRAAAVIPERTLSRAPTAELRENQWDQDTLPPYDVLDAVLERYIERDQSTAQIIVEGFDAATVHWIARAVDRNEYKRKQAAVGIKVTSRAFGTGRRMPIAARYDAEPRP